MSVFDGRVFDHAPSGFFTIEIAGEKRNIAVSDGIWSAELPPGRATISTIALDRREARSRRGEYDFAPGASNLIEADFLRRGRLRVVDAKSGESLSGLEVVLADTLLAGAGAYPESRLVARPLITDGVSPLEMPDALGVNRFWIRAPEYAWRAVSFSGNGGERCIDLVPGGELSVSATGLDHARTYWISLHSAPRDARATPVLLREPFDGSWSYPAVEAGARVEVLVTTGDARSLAPETIVAREVITIPAGERLARSIELLPAGRVGELVVLVVLPESKDDARLLLHSEGLLRPLIVEVKKGEALDDSTYVCRVAGVPEGPCRVQLTPYGYERACEVIVGGTTETAIVVENPARVRVDVRSEGAPVIPDGVMWRFVPPGPHDSWASAKPAANGGFEFLARAGRVELWCNSRTHSPGRVEHDLDAGANMVELEVEPVKRVELEVRLVDGDAEVPVSPRYWSDVEVDAISGSGGVYQRRLSGTGSTSGTSMDVASATLVIDRAGDYVLRFPQVLGYLPIEPRTVRIVGKAGERLQVALEREARR